MQSNARANPRPHLDLREDALADDLLLSAGVGVVEQLRDDGALLRRGGTGRRLLLLRARLQRRGRRHGRPGPAGAAHVPAASAAARQARGPAPAEVRHAAHRAGTARHAETRTEAAGGAATSEVQRLPAAEAAVAAGPAGPAAAHAGGSTARVPAHEALRAGVPARTRDHAEIRAGPAAGGAPAERRPAAARQHRGPVSVAAGSAVGHAAAGHAAGALVEHRRAAGRVHAGQGPGPAAARGHDRQALRVLLLQLRLAHLLALRQRHVHRLALWAVYVQCQTQAAQAWHLLHAADISEADAA